MSAAGAATFEIFATLLKSQSGLSIGPDKQYLLDSRMAPILKQEGLADLSALALRLRGSGLTALGRQVVEAMTTNESFFFRDEKPFTHVRTQVLARLHAARPAGKRLRIWSAASSSGQEAYSLAMILADQRALLGNRPTEIIGTDIARDQLARAREGRYTRFEVQRGLPMQMLVKYFTKVAADWQVKEPIRAMAEFREWNLLGDLRGLGRFDIVFCRNVLIYFDAPTKARVLEAIARQMPPDGVLYLGGSETTVGVTKRFVPLTGERGAYGVVAG